MATIGTFTHDRDGFLVGSIRTLTLDTPAQMEPITSDTEGAPAYRLFAGEIELGAAWAKTAKESGLIYHQVRLDDPSFPAPIFASLFADEDTGTYRLIWNRPKLGAKSSRRTGTQRQQPRKGSTSSSRARARQ